MIVCAKWKCFCSRVRTRTTLLSLWVLLATVQAEANPPAVRRHQDSKKTGEEIERLYHIKYPHLPNRSVTCDGIQAPSKDCTIVTALIDLNREQWPHFKRNLTHYLYYSVSVLHLNIPMVIFVDDKVRDFVDYHRLGKEHLTQVVEVAGVEDLEYYRERQRIADIMATDEFKCGHPYITHPEGFSTDYNILMNSKFSLMYHAATKNYLRTSYFYWLDVGYGHGDAKVFPQSCLWMPTNILNGVDQITYIELNRMKLLKSVDDLYKQKLPPFLNGGFFGGPRTAVKRYYFLHREVFREFLDQGKMDDDQTLAVACYFKSPSLFNLVEGWWYDAFTLFR